MCHITSIKKYITAFLFLFCINICPELSLAQSPYLWKSVIVGGGGFVPALYIIPRKKITLCATDMGGAYRWIIRWINGSIDGYDGSNQV